MKTLPTSPRRLSMTFSGWKNGLTLWVLSTILACGVVVAGEPAAAPSPKSAKPDATTLVGKGAVDVQTTLGKPMGKMQTATGALWLYADWKIQFDAQEKVSKVEKDAPVRLAQPDARYLALSEAIAKAERERAADNLAARAEANAAAGSGTVRIISNRGERVDLASLLADGKVTIVDFFARGADRAGRSARCWRKWSRTIRTSRS